jgi:hypothetical protein
MALRFYNHGKFFSPVQITIGYVFIGCGIFFSFYKLSALFFLIPGLFMALTYSGTVLDTDDRKFRPYTCLFGMITTGKWLPFEGFTHFIIQRATRKYTSYSRGSVRFDMNISDVKLLLANKNGSRKILIARFDNFELAQKEKEDLSLILFSSDKNFINQKAEFRFP